MPAYAISVSCAQPEMGRYVWADDLKKQGKQLIIRGYKGQCVNQYDITTTQLRLAHTCCPSSYCCYD
jgi:hypothetical protein